MVTELKNIQSRRMSVTEITLNSINIERKHSPEATAQLNLTN